MEHTIRAVVAVEGLDAFDVQRHPSDPSRVRFARTNFGPFTLDIGTTEALQINGLGGDDSIVVRAQPGTAVAFRGDGGEDSLVFDTGEPHLKRVPMMEPLRGGADLVGAMIDAAEDAADLLRRLGG